MILLENTWLILFSLYTRIHIMTETKVAKRLQGNVYCHECCNYLSDVAKNHYNGNANYGIAVNNKLILTR